MSAPCFAKRLSLDEIAMLAALKVSVYCSQSLRNIAMTC